MFYVYGAEEFFYLLGKCLFNYGGLIGHGMYEHFNVAEESKESGLPNEQKIANNDESNDALVGSPKILDKSKRGPQERSKHPINATTSSESAPDSRLDLTSHCGNSQDLDFRGVRGSAATKQFPARSRGRSEDEIQVRETIKSMKVDLFSENSVLDFADIAGIENVKMALEEFACFFLHFPHLTHNLRQRSTTGILLFGPQGTGKTLLIKSFAKKYNLSLYDIRASAIMSKFVGESEKFIRALFEEVRHNTPAVLMLDECDGLLCNPATDAMQSHNYRLLQNELKNQWSDLIYSRDEVIIIGATNKPHDIDLDGFGRRLSLKLHVDLPNSRSCGLILKGALSQVRHQLEPEDFGVLGLLCFENNLSGYDIDCLVESQLRKAIRTITVARFFTRIPWEGGTICVPCDNDHEGAEEGGWNKFGNPQELSYRPFTYGEVELAIRRARPTVDPAMKQKHVAYADQYASTD